MNEQITTTTTDSATNSSRKTSIDGSGGYLSQPLTYGKDLWDCLSVLTDNTAQKSTFMKSFKTFLQSYKKAFEQLGQSLNKANTQFDKDFVQKGKVMGEQVDTLSTAMMNVKMVLDDITKSVTTKAELLTKDLIEPLETYQKQYNTSNQELLRQASQFWSNLHNERTTMLFAKENYYNQMQNLQTYQQSITDTPPIVDGDRIMGLPEDSPYFAHDKKLQSQQSKADISKSEYERALTKLNGTIDSFDTQYRPILRRIQDNDDSHIDYMRHNLERFAGIIDELGSEYKQSGDDFNQAASKISSDTDLKIFIHSNKSQNPFLQKEDFQVYENLKAEVVVKGRKGTFSEDTWLIDTKKPLISQLSEKLTDSRRGSKLNQIGSGFLQDEHFASDDFQKQALKDGFIDEREYILDKMHSLIRSKPITDDEKVLAMKLIHSKDFRVVITEVLNDINGPKHLESFEAQQQLADILRYILSLFMQEKTHDYKLLYTIIESSQNIFTCVNPHMLSVQIHNRKHYLSTLIADHDLWQDPKKWRDCISEIVTMKVEDAAKRKKNKTSTVAQLTNEKESNFFKKGFKSLKGILTSKDKQLQQEMRQQQNLIFNEMSRFVQSFINFSLPYEKANELLITYCNQFQLEQSRVHLLLTELVSNQKNPSQMFTEKEQLIWSLQRRGNRLKNFGFSDKMQIVGMTIKFIDNDEMLRNILLLCKDFNDLLKQEILKQALLRSSPERLKFKRRQLWLNILEIDSKFVENEYLQYLAQSKTDALTKLVSDAIEVDVHRSFNHLKAITGDNLNNILKSYAVCNQSLDYCQGMNFIAGFLYLFFDSEAYAFAVMKEIISKFKMSELFNKELPMLKLNFYQLDRLISIVLPDLHTHFKVTYYTLIIQEETINSSYYSAPYFITLFTSCLQAQTTGDHFQKLLRLWDYFIINGWKSVFKSSLIVLKENEDQLLTMPFEVMLTQIVNMPMKFFIVEYENEVSETEGIVQFDKQMTTLKIPTMLLERLKKEFDENYLISVMTSGKQDSKNGTK